jgi:hypothetical protein
LLLLYILHHFVVFSQYVPTKKHHYKPSVYVDAPAKNMFLQAVLSFKLEVLSEIK